MLGKTWGGLQNVGLCNCFVPSRCGLCLACPRCSLGNMRTHWLGVFCGKINPSPLGCILETTISIVISQTSHRARQQLRVPSSGVGEPHFTLCLCECPCSSLCS